MKKLLGILFTGLLLTSFITAQEIDINDSNKGIRVGADVKWQPVLGELSNYVSSSIGGGIVAEFDLPVLDVENIVLGIPVHADFGVNPVKSELLKSMMNAQISSGIYGRFLLLDNEFIIQPELNYGISMVFPSVVPGNGNELDAIYVDQMLQFSLGFRYAPKAINDGFMEFELAPVYTLCLENANVVQAVGGRLGVLFKIY